MENFCLDAASTGYRAKREALLRAEIALKDRCEEVAALRRGLPADTPAPQDYEFIEAAPGDAGAAGRPRLSDLLAHESGRLVVYHFMWAPEDAEPCPMCALWCDGLAAVREHVERAAALALVAKQEAAAVRRFADARGWGGLRVLSSGGMSFNRDFDMETPEGGQRPGVSVFLRGSGGAPRHFYTASAFMGGGHYRGLDLLSPLWSLLDLLPEGRGDFMPGIDAGGAR